MLVNLFSMVGCIVALVVAASLLVTAAGYLVHCRAEAAWRNDQLVARDAKRDVGAKMVSLCHWFSEDMAAMKAIRAIGDDLQRTGDFDVTVCREQWRREVESARTGVDLHRDAKFPA